MQSTCTMQSLQSKIGGLELQRQMQGPPCCRRWSSMRVHAATQDRRSPALPPRNGSSGPANVVMRQLGPAGGANGTAAPTPASYNGTTNYTGNGTASSNANGSNGVTSSGRGIQGLVVARAPVGALMPAARAAAAEVQQVIEAQPSLSNGASATVDVAARELPSDQDFRWAQDDYNATQRTVDTWTFFTVFRTRLWLLDQKWSYPGGFSEARKDARSRSLARYLVRSILNLGPTFIKIGQLSSTRADLFPAAFTEELAELQDRVPAFGADKAVAIIERDLGAPVEKLFRSFERRPIAAASLGQVHRAVLHSGEQVVVKVQRPGLRQLFDIDLANLKLLAEQLDKGDEARDFKGIYEECAQVLYQEIDYINEGRNADRFRRNFRDLPWVKTPVVYWQYCSPRVMTMQYLPGIKITDVARLRTADVPLDLVAGRATEAYLTQVLRHGFFHADPHPGNLAVGPSGELIFYDFGMMGEIVPDVRERLLDVFYGIYKKDANQVIDALVALKVITATGDRLALRRSIAYFLDNITQQTERRETINRIGEDLFAIALDQPFRFPATFTFVLRAFSTLEGIGKTLNPQYQFAEVAQPYASELLELQDARAGQRLLLQQLQQQATEVGQAAAAMPLRIARINDTLEQLESGDLRLRVRVLEAERAARRAGVLQGATMNSVAAVGMLNMGAQLALAQHEGIAAVCLGLSSVFGVLMLLGLRRVKRLDKFEKEVRGG